MNNNEEHPIKVYRQVAREGYCVVDVREKWEYDAGHIANAMHIPLSELPERAESIPSTGIVYVYCASGVRSASAVDYLRSLGMRGAINVAGGIHEWEKSGLPVVSGEREGSDD